MIQEIELLKHQHEFISDIDTRYIGLVGGYGCGKTYAFCMKGIYLAALNVGHRGVLLEPTNAMVADVLIPEFEQILYDYNIPFEARKSPYPSYIINFGHGSTEILLRSAENYKRLAGLNLAFFGVDEADLIEKGLATKMWRILQSRLRSGKVYQGFTTSTPEGFNFLYDFFAKRESLALTDRRFIQARTRDNPHLPQEFIDSLMENYPPNLIEAYLEGKFVNLNSGSVYHSFDRKLNHSDLSLDDDTLKHHVLHCGQDFNIGQCTTVVHVIYKGVPYAVDELTGIKNTEEVIKTIKRRYPHRHIIMYPDSSGKSEKTNATYTDIVLLRNAFGAENVRYRTKNPRVSDRVGSMNAMFLNMKGERRYYVNTDKCPTYTDALEQQAYNDKGEPDKTTGQDHPVDAGGYFISFRFPLVDRPSLLTT